MEIPWNVEEILQGLSELQICLYNLGYRLPLLHIIVL